MPSHWHKRLEGTKEQDFEAPTDAGGVCAALIDNVILKELTPTQVKCVPKMKLRGHKSIKSQKAGREWRDMDDKFAILFMFYVNCMKSLQQATGLQPNKYAE